MLEPFPQERIDAIVDEVLTRQAAADASHQEATRAGLLCTCCGDPKEADGEPECLSCRDIGR